LRLALNICFFFAVFFFLATFFEVLFFFVTFFFLATFFEVLFSSLLSFS